MIPIYNILLNLTAASFLEWVSLGSSVWIKNSDDHQLSWIQTQQLLFLLDKSGSETEKLYLINDKLWDPNNINFQKRLVLVSIQFLYAQSGRLWSVPWLRLEKFFGFLMEMYLKLTFRIQKHCVMVIAMLRGTFRLDLSIS